MRQQMPLHVALAELAQSWNVSITHDGQRYSVRLTSRHGRGNKEGLLYHARDLTHALDAA